VEPFAGREVFGGWVWHRSEPWAPAAPTLLALHGFTGSGLDFSPLALETAREGAFNWIAPDLPGHGATGLLREPGAHSLPAMAGTLSAFVRSRACRPLVLAYSMGGRLALHWVIRQQPDLAGLILVGASPGLGDPSARATRRAEDNALAARIRQIGAEAFAREWESRPLMQTQAAIPEPHRGRLRARRRAQDPEGLARSLEEAGTGAMDPLWEELQDLRPPVLFVAGERDARFREIARRMEAKVRAAGRWEVPAAGHCAHLENAAAFSLIISQFAFAKRLGST
jgi:2-succinyl-6-hydroxy-2,4-cyclohexadiene-1-carboxylate synthase